MFRNGEVSSCLDSRRCRVTARGDGSFVGLGVLVRNNGVTGEADTANNDESNEDCLQMRASLIEAFHYWVPPVALVSVDESVLVDLSV